MTKTRTRLNLSAGLASTLVAVTLVGLKLWALGETQALSVAASLADSAMDLMVSLGALAAIWYAARPADEDHAFGHSAAEDLAALGQSLFIMMSAGIITWAAFSRLWSGEPTPIMAHQNGIIAMAISIGLTVALVLWQRYVAAQTGSTVVKADSLHYLGDLIPNIGAIMSLFAAQFFGMEQIDSIVAIGAAIILAVGALGIFKTAWDGLMDHAADPDLVASIEDIARNHPGVHGFHDLKTRRSGSVTFIVMHVELDGQQTLEQAHSIGASLRRAILHAHPNTDVLIHKDPVGVIPHPNDPSRMEGAR